MKYIKYRRKGWIAVSSFIKVWFYLKDGNVRVKVELIEPATCPKCETKLSKAQVLFINSKV